MIKYLIVDDEHIAHDIIKGYGDLLPNLQLMKNCYDALEALEYLNKNEIDLIFLDLNMPKLKGFEFLRTLSSPPKIIVTTAYKEHAIEGYELNIVDYLLKPFSFQRFLKAVNKAVVAAPSTTTTSNIPSVPQSIFLQSNKKYIQVYLKNILFIEASGNYTKVITQDQVIMIRKKISELLQTLSSEKFIQVHKSFAVSKEHITLVEGNRITIQDHIIPIGSMYKMNIKKILDNRS